MEVGTGKIITDKMADLLAENTSNNIIFQGGAALVNQTPNFNFEDIEFSSKDKHVSHDFVADQLQTRIILESSETEETAILFEQAKNLSTTIGFCNQWNAYYPKIKELLKTLDDAKDNATLVKGFNSLKNAASLKSKEAVELIKGLNNLKTALENNLTHLNMDQVIFNKYFDDKGSPIKISEEVDSYLSQMASDNKTLSRGATRQGLGIAIIVVVIVLEAFSKSQEENPSAEPSDASNKAITYSVEMIKDDIKQQNEASEDWKTTFEKYKGLISSLEYDKKLYITIQNYMSAVKLLVNTLNDSKQNEISIQSEWNNLSNYFDNLSKEIVGLKSNAKLNLSNEIESFNTSINILKTTAVAMQNQGMVKIESHE